MTIKTITTLPALGLCLLLTGCSTSMVRDAETKPRMQEAFELPADATAQPPAEVRAALLPPLQIQLPGITDGAGETRFDVRVRHIRARDFFLSLIEGTPYDMVIHPKLGGYVSLDLKNTTVPEVMEVVRSVLGYDYKRTGHTIQVFPNTMHSRLFKVDYLAAKRLGGSVTTSKTGQISTNNGNGGGSVNSSTIQTDSNSDFWEELKAALTLLLGNAEGRMVSVNAQTGIVLVHAEPAEMRIIEEFLEQSKNILHRQVILEARILEVTLSDAFQTGINWSSLQQDSVISQTGGGSIFGGNGATSLQGSSGLLDLTTSTNAINAATTALGGVFTIGLSTPDFAAFIELLKSQGDVQVLSSPRVSTVNNQKAVIKVGNDEFYVTNIDTQDNTSTTGGTTSLSVELEPFFSGVALDVIPQISAEGDIVLHIHPAVSEVSEQVKSISTTFGSLTMPLAASNIRESDTVIRAKNGQVVVIGGLMQNVSQDEQSGVPVLSDIPLLGALFRHTKKVTRKSELVILLKPTVIDADGQVWQQQLQHSSGNINRLNQGM
ncbi:MAG: pilus (MSHA type) biogenesis protein MshL [Gammaproteobacteria bacterium]|nr:pilus (MSHA type) biogenesis protein MshL [Gammaproteobacteria bacterium]